MTEAHRTIAIVNNEKSILTLLDLAFKEAGYRASTYLHSGEALPAVIAPPPDILVLNWFMQPVHGVEFFRRYRECHGTQVVFVSANVDDTDPELAGDVPPPVLNEELAGIPGRCI